MKRNLATAIIMLPLLAACGDAWLKESGTAPEVSLDGSRWLMQTVTEQPVPYHFGSVVPLPTIETVMDIFPQAVWERQVTPRTDRKEYIFRTVSTYSLDLTEENAILRTGESALKKVFVFKTESVSYSFAAGEYFFEDEEIRHELSISDTEFLYTTRPLHGGAVSIKRRQLLKEGKFSQTLTNVISESVTSTDASEERIFSYTRKGQDIVFEEGDISYQGHFYPDYSALFIGEGMIDFGESEEDTAFPTLFNEKGKITTAVSKKSFNGEADKYFDNTSWECKGNLYFAEVSSDYTEGVNLDLMFFRELHKQYPDIEMAIKDSVCKVTRREGYPDADLKLSFSKGKAVMSGRISGVAETAEMQVKLLIYTFPEARYFRENADGRYMLDVSGEGMVEYFITEDGEAVCPDCLQALKNGRAVCVSDFTIISSKTENINETVARTYSYKRINPFLFINDGKEELFSLAGEQELYFQSSGSAAYAYPFRKKD